MLLCPVCHEPLVDDERGGVCAGGHWFDRAREGYLYLLRSSKSGDSMGDPKSQARSRRDFLNRGYYAPLRDAMVELVRKQTSGCATSANGPMTLLDICCGEGYYTSAMGGVCSPKDIETMLQLLYLNFTQPRFNKDDVDNLTKMLLAQLANAKSNPDFLMQEKVADVTYGPQSPPSDDLDGDRQ